MTALAGGNVAAAVLNASLSTLLGVFLTPLLASWVIAGADGQALAVGETRIEGLPERDDTRHIAAARAKNGMDESGVAAFLGHVSTRTATSHYARKRSAKEWAPLRVTVDPAQTATVRKTYRARGAERTPSSSNRPTI